MLLATILQCLPFFSLFRSIVAQAPHQPVRGLNTDLRTFYTAYLLEGEFRSDFEVQFHDNRIAPSLAPGATEEEFMNYVIRGQPPPSEPLPGEMQEFLRGYDYSRLVPESLNIHGQLRMEDGWLISTNVIEELQAILLGLEI
jgi:hypothetical protein